MVLLVSRQGPVVGIICCLFTVIAGSKIQLDITPSVIKDGLTPSMKLRCSLDDSILSSPSGAIVGRDVTQTSLNVLQLSSILVTQNGLDLASVTQKTPSKALVNPADFTVDGDISGYSTEHGFIELTWTNPNQSQQGEFKCEANTIDNVGHGVVFSTTQKIIVSTPTVMDLVQHIQNIESINAQQTTHISDLEEKIKNQDSEMQVLKSEHQALNTKVLASEDEIERLKHVESGYLECGDSDHNNWSDGRSPFTRDDGRISNQTLAFKKVYDKAPIVFLSILEPDYWFTSKAHNNVQYGVSLKSVNRNNFVVGCFVDTDHAKLYHMRALWISFSN